MSLEQIIPEVPAVRSTASLDDWNKTTPNQAALAGKSLAGCWRKDDAHDPDTFATAMTAVFTMYAPDVVQYVCDPRTGLPKTHRWPPSISEVHDACAERIAEKERSSRYKNWGNNDPEQRERMKDQGRLPLPVEVKPTREEIEAKYGKGWGIGGPVPTDAQMKAFCRTLPPGTQWTTKQLIEKWQEQNLTPEGEAPQAAQTMSPDDLVAHYSEHDLAFTPKGSMPAGADPAMAAKAEMERGPAVPLVAADGTTYDAGADF